MESKKERVIKILKRIGIAISIGFNAIFIVALIIGGFSSKKQNNKIQCASAESEINYKLDTKKYVSYNDNDYEITLNANELTDYTWFNFNNFLCSLLDEAVDISSTFSNTITSLYYNNNLLNIDDVNFSFDRDFLRFTAYYNDDYVYFNINAVDYVDNNKFIYAYYPDDVAFYSDFEYSSSISIFKEYSKSL